MNMFGSVPCDKGLHGDIITCLGGWGEIRTHGPLARATVFKTVPLDHSGTHPCTKILSHFAHIFNLEYTVSMRFLGIDYGSKRIGIAHSDEGGQFAMPLITLNNSKN